MKYEQETPLDTALVQDLVSFLCGRLEVDEPDIRLVDDDDGNMADVYGRTGTYDPLRGVMHVFTAGRHPKDVLRSLSHEMYHHYQAQMGLLDDQSLGGDSVGGNYIKKNRDLREIEGEAYKNGNLLFREWEEEKKKQRNENKDTENMTLQENRFLRISRGFGFNDVKILKS